MLVSASARDALSLACYNRHGVVGVGAGERVGVGEDEGGGVYMRMCAPKSLRLRARGKNVRCTDRYDVCDTQ